MKVGNCAVSDASNVLVIDDLVSATSLDVSVLAGAGGLGREVLWAHSCELSDPERWLGPHELLMTVGLCVPIDPAEQAAFIGRLDDAGLAGLMIGDHETAPALSADMYREADKRDFPVLFAATHTPYAVVARHVAASNTSSQLLQVLKLSKLYHVAASTDENVDELVASMVDLLRIDIRVVDRATGVTVVDAKHPSKARPVPESRSYALRGTHPAELYLSEYPGEALESLVLVHLLKVLEINVDRILTNADRRAERGARAFRLLLEGEKSDSLDEYLAPYSAPDGFQVVAFQQKDGERVAREFTLRGLPVLVGLGRVSALALVPIASQPAVRAALEAAGVQCGVSSVFADYMDVAIAAEEADKVLASVAHSSRLWTEFVGTTVSVLSRSRREAEEIISAILGSLAEEASAERKLRETLFAFLRNDRNWKRTAGELGIHRQTLAYRLRRVEEETGARLSRSADLSALWIAYQAWESTHVA